VLGEGDAFSRQEKQRNLFKKNKQYLKFDSQLKLEDFLRAYRPKDQKLPPVSERDLEAAFASLYKETPAQKHVDCQACGYATCRDMATAVARGFNFPANCHQYTLQSNLNEQQRINELSDELTAEVASMISQSDSIISNAGENASAIDSIQKTVQTFQALSDAIMENIA